MIIRDLNIARRDLGLTPLSPEERKAKQQQLLDDAFIIYRCIRTPYYLEFKLWFRTATK